MKLTKKSGGVVAAVVMAGGLTAASATSAFAAPAHPSKTASAAKGSDAAKKDDAKTRHGRHHRMGTHGERTVKGEDGKTVVHEWQVGAVTAVSGDTVTVKSSDGFTMTWTAGSTTKLHTGKAGSKVKVGDKVLVEGVKSGSVNEAHVVIDRTARHAAKTPEKPGEDKDKKPATGKHRKPDAPQSHYA